MPLFPPVAPQGPYYYLPNGWNTAWNTAKATANTQPVAITAIGDSITWGWGASDFASTSWWALLRSALLSKYGSLGGDYYSVLWSSMFSTETGGPTTAVYPLIFGGTFNTNVFQNNAAYNFIAIPNAGLTPFLTVTPPYSVVGFDIIWADYAPGTWSYQVDGGSSTNVTATGNSTFANAQCKKISITGLTAGSHTLTINSGASNDVANIVGVTAYAAAGSGFRFGNMGWPGMGLVTGSSAGNALSDTSTFPVDRLAMYQGFTGTTASPTAAKGFGFPAQPDLMIISFGVNDAFQSVTAANFQAALNRVIFSCRYGKSDACSIILIAQWGPDGVLSDGSTITNFDYTGTTETGYSSLRDVMLQTARELNCAFVDVYSSFGRYPVTNGLVTSTTNLHPTNAGHAAIAALLEAIL